MLYSRHSFTLIINFKGRDDAIALLYALTFPNDPLRSILSIGGCKIGIFDKYL